MAPARVTLALLVSLLVAGCGLLPGQEALAEKAGLAAYEGEGLTVGYPKGWMSPGKDRRLFPEADFEAAAGGAGRYELPQGTFAVDVMHKEQSVASLAEHYARVADRRPGGKVLGRAEIELAGGHVAQRLDRASVVPVGSGVTITRRIDLYVRVGPQEIADVILLYTERAYASARPEIDKIISAIEVTGR